MVRMRVGVLISGRGSNLQALIEAGRDPDFPAEIVAVVSNRPEAQGLARAEAAGIAATALDHRRFATRQAFEAELTACLERAGVELVCQAGFMRILTGETVQHWHDRMINIHPSLLPMFPGLDTHAKALAAGLRIHGCTVHYVREAVDSGPIIGQAAVPVMQDDDEASLAGRVLEAEHRLYPRCLALVASGQARVVEEKVVLTPALSASGALINPPPLAARPPLRSSQ
jgi:phosphoribosylglycinamide formyltransferase-1